MNVFIMQVRSATQAMRRDRYDASDLSEKKTKSTIKSGHGYISSYKNLCIALQPPGNIGNKPQTPRYQKKKKVLSQNKTEDTSQETTKLKYDEWLAAIYPLCFASVKTQTQNQPLCFLSKHRLKKRNPVSSFFGLKSREKVPEILNKTGSAACKNLQEL